ncbi:hypothetical protein JOC70_000705 [Clostridium pascui]|uniref:hypothetical protein n=1 Tax=Clostridium pascui TaxID=46609 RepID=UPI001959AF6A|nr:hypothetical protein [Clostridium pascui]MBM7869236.1 hypothetical protein [Clostridium pascui]
MERINLSDFKAISKFNFVNGMFNKVKKNLENKELEFFGVNEDAVKSLTERKISNNDIEFLYGIIPIISNVNVDINFEEFEKMCRCPSPQFTDYIALLLQHFKELYTSASKLNNLEAEVSSSLKELNIELEEAISVKTKEELLEELYTQLSDSKNDKAKRKEILKQITDLEVEENA